MIPDESKKLKRASRTTSPSCDIIIPVCHLGDDVVAVLVIWQEKRGAVRSSEERRREEAGREEE